MLRGTITAIITPFDSNGAVDENALRKLVNFQIDNGIIGIVPCGTTGESPTLNHEEHNRVIDIVIQESRGKVPIIAGTGSNSTKEAIDLTRHAQESGADYSLQVAPYYNKPTQRGFYEHFLSIAETIDLPLIIYNIPGRTGKNIETDTLLRLAEHKNIAGVKEASGSISQIMDIISQRPAEFTVLSGDDNLTLPIVISVASNIIPKQVSELVDGALKGNWGEARRCHYRLLPLFKTLFLETNPIPIKTALAMKGIIKEFFRSPLCAMEPENREKLKIVLESQEILQR